MGEAPQEPSDDNVFTEADLNTDILRCVRVAHEVNVISVIDAFLLGMTQKDQEDWENGDDLIEILEQRMFKANNDLNSDRPTYLIRDPLKPLEWAIQNYRDNIEVAKRESALDFPGGDWE